ncbi:MAG: hypothetical protein RLZZ332_308 [Actinomycetota bacterium]
MCAACTFTHGLCALNAHDFSPHVSEHHRGEWARADAGNLYDAKTVERAGHARLLLEDEVGDRVDDFRPQRLRNVVTHIVKQHQLRTGDDLGRALGGHR